MIYWSDDRKLVEREFVRMGFDKDARWRISDINKNFELCNTYPRFIIIPSEFKDIDLESVAKFRYFRRIPTAVWRHIKNGCFIVRSSQPTVGWFGWFRSEVDENLVQSYVSNTSPPNSEQSNDHGESPVGSLNGADDKCDQQAVVDSNDRDEDICDRARRTSQNEDLNYSKQQIEMRLHSNHNNNLQDTSDINNIGNGKATVEATTSTITPNTARPTTKIDTEDQIFSETSSSKSQIQGPNCTVNGSRNSSPSLSHDTSADITNEADSVSPTSSPKMLIIDARSYTAAMANRAKGGGCECSEYYLRCEVQFMNLANIHSIRKSFHAIRSVCEAYSEQSNK